MVSYERWPKAESGASFLSVDHSGIPKNKFYSIGRCVPLPLFPGLLNIEILALIKSTTTLASSARWCRCKLTSNRRSTVSYVNRILYHSITVGTLTSVIPSWSRLVDLL